MEVGLQVAAGTDNYGLEGKTHFIFQIVSPGAFPYWFLWGLPH